MRKETSRAMLLALAAAMPALGAISGATPTRAYEAIQNEEERPNPWVINGCTIEAKTKCPNADLRFQDLRGANFQGADLHGALFDRSDLRYANFQGANVAGADFRGADLRLVYMQGAKAQNASFVGANLESGRISGSNMNGADFTVADLEMTMAKRATFIGAKFDNTDMQEAKFQETNLANAIMVKPQLRFVNFEDAWMKDCNGCPMHWQSDKPVWEIYPLSEAPKYPDAPPEQKKP